MVIRDKDVFKRQIKYNGNILFPSSHDIAPENLHAATIVLENLLKVGNRVMIVSKPRLVCIEQLCKYFRNYKDQILFRFTIGALDNAILKFWEPGAPEYEERKECLALAYEKKFDTSVSAEPMLDFKNIDQLVDDLMPFITDALWVGKMNKIRNRVNIDDEEMKAAVTAIEEGQTDEIIIDVYARYKDNPKVKWKDSIKKIVGLERAKKPGLDK
jgi:DNA repair photolyase